MKNKEIIKLIMENQKKADMIVHENYHSPTQKYDLSLDQFHLLLELDELMLDLENETQAPTIGAIAKNVNVSQNTVSERITRLEKKELVQRIEDNKDRRVSHVVLTKKGKELLKSINKEAETDFVKTALSRMTVDELKDFLRCYEKLIYNMSFINKTDKGDVECGK